MVIQDDIEMIFHDILDWKQFGLRVAQKDIKRLPEILQGFSEDELAHKQKALSRVWHRCVCVCVLQSDGALARCCSHTVIPAPHAYATIQCTARHAHASVHRTACVRSFSGLTLLTPATCALSSHVNPCACVCVCVHP